MLCGAVPNPVAFDARCTWVANSAALKRSGVTRDTAGGEIVHDEHGEPNGILRNANSVLRGLREPPRSPMTRSLPPSKRCSAPVKDEEIGVYPIFRRQWIRRHFLGTDS